MASAVHTAGPVTESKPSRSFLAYAGIAVVLAAVSVLALLLVRGQSSVTYPPHSPQRAVSTYLNLLQAGKVDQAYRMTDLDPGPGGVMTLSEFHQQWDNWSTRSHRVTLVQTARTGNISSVTVEITSFSANGFGPSEETTRVTFTLALLHGSWWVTGPTYSYLP